MLDHWPERLGLMGTNGALRLTFVEPFTISGFVGDIVRFIPDLPPDAPPFEFASERQPRSRLQLLTRAGNRAAFFALAPCLFCAIVGSGKFVTIQAWDNWDLGQKLP